MTVGRSYGASEQLGVREELGMPPIGRRPGDDEGELVNRSGRGKVQLDCQIGYGLGGGSESIKFSSVHEVSKRVVMRL